MFQAFVAAAVVYAWCFLEGWSSVRKESTSVGLTALAALALPFLGFCLEPDPPSYLYVGIGSLIGSAAICSSAYLKRNVADRP